MKKIITFRKLPYLILILTIIIIIINLWLYFPELTIKSDPNDNIFQFAQVSQVSQVWEETAKNCNQNRIACHLSRITYLIDHWDPQWAMGYPLPFYYSHLPQVAIVSSHKLAVALPLVNNQNYSLFLHFNLIKYFVLCFLPLSFFLAAKNFGFSPLASALSAFFAAHLSTDGLYGIDPASYLWRGYGLSSQLFAVFFLPLAVSWISRGLKEDPSASWWKKKGLPVLFLWLTAQAHLGVGLMAFASGLAFLFIDLDWQEIQKRFIRLVKIYSIALFFLLYHILPFLYLNRYHNVSFWDPIWKFESFGFQEVSKMFFNGALLDFGRWPILTGLAVLGFFWVLQKGQSANWRSKKNATGWQSLGLLLPFWLALFFGSRTWGPLITTLPFLGGFHQHRFLVGVQLVGVFLAALGAEKMFSYILRVIPTNVGRIEKFTPSLPNGSRLHSNNNTSLALLLIIPLFYLLLQPTYRYAQLNTQWLKTANQQFDHQWPNFEELLKTLETLPKGRVYSGRPGNWGREFKIGDTPVYMALSVRGIPIIGFLPESWSPNSDTEQFFNEQRQAHYDLYNLRYVVAPDDIIFPEFVKPVEKIGKFNLYQIPASPSQGGPTSGYFSLGTENISVTAKKGDFANLVHLWQNSDLVENKSFPILSLSNPESTSLQPGIKMTNEVSYQISGDNQIYNIFFQPPFSAPLALPSGEIINETVSTQRYQAQIKVDDSCQNCFLVFKMTYHPNWQITLDGKPTKSQIAFPFFQAIPINPGEHEVIASYQPNRLRIFLLVASFAALLALIARKCHLPRT